MASETHEAFRDHDGASGFSAVPPPVAGGGITVRAKVRQCPVEVIIETDRAVRALWRDQWSFTETGGEDEPRSGSEDSAGLYI